MDLTDFMSLAAKVYQNRNKRSAKMHCRKLVRAACNMIDLGQDRIDAMMHEFDWQGVAPELIKQTQARRILQLSESAWRHRLRNPDLYPEYQNLTLIKEGCTSVLVPKYEVMALAEAVQGRRGLIH